MVPIFYVKSSVSSTIFKTGKMTNNLHQVDKKAESKHLCLRMNLIVKVINGFVFNNHVYHIL